MFSGPKDAPKGATEDWKWVLGRSKEAKHIQKFVLSKSKKRQKKRGGKKYQLEFIVKRFYLADVKIEKSKKRDILRGPPAPESSIPLESPLVGFSALHCRVSEWLPS